MPQALTQETIERYERALRLRDAGHTFRTIATECGYADAGTARYAWIGGLRLAGRNSEIPQRVPRTISISHNGRTTTATVETQIGFTMLQNLTFGVEFEIINASCNDAERIMRSAGYDLHNGGYTHSVMNIWKVVTDASLTSRTSNCEVVSPVLRGSDGLNEVRTVAKVLRDAGASINSSCGMHIHIGVDGLITNEQQAHVIKAHQQWSHAFDALVVESRINGQWARKIDRGTALDIADEWTQHADLRNGNSFATASQYRYRALNLNAFAKYGTFEFRSHQGSLNGLNATAWIAFHTAFIKAAHLLSADSESPYALLAHSDNNQWTSQYEQNSVHGGTVSRAAQVQACKYLAKQLHLMGLLDLACAEHIINRAGNIPARSNNN